MKASPKPAEAHLHWKQLEDGRPLSDYDSTTSRTTQLFTLSSGFEVEWCNAIFSKTSIGKTITLLVEPSDSI